MLTIAVTMALLASACSDDGNDNGNIATSGTESTATEAPQETEAPEDPVAAAEQRVTDAEDGVTRPRRV